MELNKKFKNNKVFAGLTGGIASGKSAVSGMLLGLGAYIIDADILSRKVVEISGLAYPKICEAFDDCVFNGVIDRYKLRERVFNNNADLKMLNSITHPIIKNEALSEAESCENDVIIFVVPLLFESGFSSLTHPNITVNCHVDLRIKRLIERDNITVALAKKIIATQLSDEERAAKADIVLANNGELEALNKSVATLYNVLKKEAQTNKKQAVYSL